MRNFFKLGLTFGSVMLLASAMPACGSDDDDPKGSGGSTGGSGGSTGGSGGSSGSATGGTSGSGTGGATDGGGKCTPGASSQDPSCLTDAATCSCGSNSCEGASLLGGAIDLAPCCSGGSACGVVVSDGIAPLINVAPGCYETEQEGTANASCPGFDFIHPTEGTPETFEGCCRPDGNCGYLVNLTSAGGPDMGCVPADCSTGGSVTTCTPGSDAGTGGSSGAAGSAGAGPGDASVD